MNAANERDPGKSVTRRVLFGAVWAAATLLAACTPSDQNVAMALATPTPDARAIRASALATIYSAAGHHDEAALIAMLPSASPSSNASASPDPAVLLGLMTLDRARYERAFVQNYPTTREALTIDYGSEFARARVVPSGALFPIAALGKIATRDDGSDAFEKLLGGVAVTNDRIGDAYRAQAHLVIGSVPPARTIGAFAGLPLSSRLAAISTLGWCSAPPTALLAYHPTPAPLPTTQATPSPFGTAASPAVSMSPSAAPFQPTPMPAQVAAIQDSIRQAVSHDCASARRAPAAARHKAASASAHTANRKTPSPTPRSH
jgi:hypothetical protein